MTALADIWSGPTASRRCCTELIADGRSPVGRSDGIHLGMSAIQAASGPPLACAILPDRVRRGVGACEWA